MTSPRLVLAPLAFTIAALLAATAPADTVHKRDGTKIEGEIVEETGAEVTIRTRFGPLTIPRAEILEIERGKTSIAQFKERWDSIDRDDPLALLELAQWCDEKGLSREAKTVYRRVLAVDSDNELARRELGYVLVDGDWLTKQELAETEKRRKAEENKAKAAAKRDTGGKGSKGGDAAEPARADAAGIAAAFLEEVAENRETDVKTAEELENFFGQKFSVASSTHFSMRLQLPPDEVKTLLAFAEKKYVECNQLFGMDPAQPVWPGRMLIFLVKQRGAFQDLIDWVDANLTEISPQMRQRSKDTGGLTFKQPLILAELENLPLERTLAHEVGNFFVWFVAGGAAGDWLTEGFGAYTAILEFGVNEVMHSRQTKYEGRIEIADKTKDSDYPLVCFDIVDGVLEKDYAFREMSRRDLNDLDYADLAKSWSVIDFLMKEHREDFLKYIVGLRRFPAETRHVDGLNAVFGWTPEELDEKWTAYVEANYSRAPTQQAPAKKGR